jgi:hypothetical protein
MLIEEATRDDACTGSARLDLPIRQRNVAVAAMSQLRTVGDDLGLRCVG